MCRLASGLVLLAIMSVTSIRVGRNASSEEANERFHQYGDGILVLSIPGALPFNNSKDYNIRNDSNYVEDHPFVKFPDAESEKMYTLMMVDPVLSKHKNDQDYYLNWLVANIEGCHLRHGKLRKGDVIAPYKCPYPERRKSKTMDPIFHRFIFVIYQQDNFEEDDKVEFNSINDTLRYKFTLIEWLSNENKWGQLVGPATGCRILAKFPPL